MTELYTLTATELAPLIKTKQLSPVDLIDSISNRMEEIDRTVNSYITPLFDSSRAQAKHAESEIINGLYKGPLHGIPIGIKDNFYTKGIRTTVGSKILCDFIPDNSATAVEKLLCAGGIMTGKLNMHEFGGGLTNTNPFYGNARNPWNLDHTPGGSSGGSAAALAAGLTTLATGTDTFGSIRVPSAMCGVYGLKPTYGLVSTHGVAPLAWSMDHVGPMARSVSDLALMLNYMAGYDSKDPGSVKAPIPDYRENLNKGIKGIKIGVPSYYLEELAPDVERLFTDAVTALQGMGAEVKEINIPELSMATFGGYVVTTGEAASYHYDRLKGHPEEYAADVRIFFESGILLNTPHYVRAQQSRRVLVDAFKKAFEDVDVMAAPTIPIAAQPFQDNWIEQNLETTKRCMPFTSPPNVTGSPSLAVPMGVSSEGLPLGMQLIGNHLSEKLLLQVGSAWEETNPLSKQCI